MPQKLLQRQIPGGSFPRRNDLNDLLFADQRDKHKVFRICQLMRHIGGNNGDPFLDGYHHENTLHIVGTEEDVRMISGLLIHLVEAEVTDGITGAGRGHEQQAFAVEL